MKKNFRMIFIIAIIAVCAYVSVSFAWFQGALSNNLFQESQNRLVKANESSIHFILQTFDEFEDQLELIADFSTLYSGDKEAIVNMLEQMNEKIEEVDYGILNIDGEYYTSNDDDIDIDWQQVQDILHQQHRYISGVISLQDTSVIIMAIPIMKEEKMVGAIVGVYQVDYLTKLFANSFFEGIGATMIIQKDGEMIASYQGMEKYADFYTMLEQFHFPKDDYNMDQMMKHMERNEDGFLVYDQNEHQRYLSYAPVGINDWYVINLVMAESLSPRFSKILQQSMLLALSYALVFMVLMFLLYRVSGRMKKIQEEALGVHRFEMLAKLQKSAIIFEYDFKKNYLHVSSNYEQRFHISAEKAKDIKVAEGILVDKKDRDQMIQQMQEQGSIQYQLELRDKENEQRWYEVEAGIVYDEQQKAARLIGFIYDIHQAYLEKQRLMLKANTDDLTKTFTKSELLHQIEDALSQKPEGRYAMMFVDLDDFKKVNDTYGHLAGDEVLSTLGELLLSSVHDGFVGRFGGDEFVIFLRNIEEEKLGVLCEQLIQKVQERMPYPVGISIGISIYGKDANSEQELLAHADAALYQAKEEGKGRYHMYE